MKDSNVRPGMVAFAAVNMLALFTLAGCGQPDPAGPQWDFVKVDQAGAELAVEISLHPCALDRRTGLLWEARTAATENLPGVFTWYNPDADAHLGFAGVEDGGECGLARCDTDAYVTAANAAGWCGRNDWRMPSRDELLTLVDPARIGQGPTLDPVYFPGTAAGEYWTATTFTMYPQGAWAIDTIYAQDRVDWKTSAKHVKLVSGSKSAVKPKGRGR